MVAAEDERVLQMVVRTVQYSTVQCVKLNSQDLTLDIGWHADILLSSSELALTKIRLK